MRAPRVWLGLLLLAVVAVGFYWVASNRDAAPMKSGTDLAASATAATPAQAVSVAAPSSSNAHRNPQQASIWRKPNHVVADDGSVAVPSQYQFAGVTSVQTGRDFDDWMAHFSEEDQKTLRGFDKHFYGVYHDRSPEQIAWMAAHGYPMPEDVLAAKFISTSKLRDMAGQGNIKAAFLLKGRELSEIVQKLQKHEITYQQIETDDPQLRDDSYMLRNLLATSDSPYGAFLQAREANVDQYGNSQGIDAGVIGALYAAQMLGDHGVRGLITSFVNSSSDPALLAYRQTINEGASAVESQFVRRQAARIGAGLPRNGCVQLSGGDDGYPSGLPHN